mmetsp:Transcript_12664/g.22974  ORF Transcript_12664/g.22974 Transcript_12664/m.22974 type:complete len:257 (-) Transcript_12664:1542-2312(-)
MMITIILIRLLTIFAITITIGVVVRGCLRLVHISVPVELGFGLGGYAWGGFGFESRCDFWLYFIVIFVLTFKLFRVFRVFNCHRNSCSSYTSSFRRGRHQNGGGSSGPRDSILVAAFAPVTAASASVTAASASATAAWSLAGLAGLAALAVRVVFLESYIERCIQRYERRAEVPLVEFSRTRALSFSGYAPRACCLRACCLPCVSFNFMCCNVIGLATASTIFSNEMIMLLEVKRPRHVASGTRIATVPSSCSPWS